MRPLERRVEKVGMQATGDRRIATDGSCEAGSPSVGLDVCAASVSPRRASTPQGTRVPAHRASCVDAAAARFVPLRESGIGRHPAPHRKLIKLARGGVGHEKGKDTRIVGDCHLRVQRCRAASTSAAPPAYMTCVNKKGGIWERAAGQKSWRARGRPNWDPSSPGLSLRARARAPRSRSAQSSEMQEGHRRRRIHRRSI